VECLAEADNPQTPLKQAREIVCFKEDGIKFDELMGFLKFSSFKIICSRIRMVKAD